MKLALTLSRRRAVKPLLAAATLTLLAGCSLPPHVQNQFLRTEYRTALYNKHPVGEMTVKDQTLLVVSVPSQRQQEVHAKYRTLFANEGVLHVFPDQSKRCYSTATLPDLSAAYLDDDGTVINITDMRANSTGQCSERPATRVLTMPYQWFKNHGIQAGDRLTDFKPVTEVKMAQILTGWKQELAVQEERNRQERAAQEKQRQQEMTAQKERERRDLAQRKAEEERLRAEQLVAQEKLKREQNIKAVRTLEFMRWQIARKKTDTKLESLREISTASGSLLAVSTDPINRCDIGCLNLYPLLPNEAIFFGRNTKEEAGSYRDAQFHMDTLKYYGADKQYISIAYLDESGRILGIHNDYPKKIHGNGLREYLTPFIKSIAYTVVASAGWFDEHGLKVGDTLTFKPVTAKRREELYVEGIQQAHTMLTQRVNDDKQVAVAAAKGTGNQIEQMLQPGKAYNHSHICNKGIVRKDLRLSYSEWTPTEEVQGLLYVQSRGADGSINAIYDMAVADVEKNSVTGVRAQMKGIKNAKGGYNFTPVRILKSGSRYKVNTIHAFGDLSQLDVNLSGSACGTPEQMGLWIREKEGPNGFASVAMPISVNLANRALHRADFYYKAEREGTRLADGAAYRTEPRSRLSFTDPIGQHLGIRLVAGGRALPGEVSSTGNMFRIDAITNNPYGGTDHFENYRRFASEFELSKNCTDTRSAYQCLHRNAVVPGERARALGQKLQPKTGNWYNYSYSVSSDSFGYIGSFVERAVTELELANSMVKAMTAEKISWTPLDFAPNYEVANYEILPGQPSANESLVKLNYRHARYVYFYSRVAMQEKMDAFLKNYTIEITDNQVKKHAAIEEYEMDALIMKNLSRSQCSDHTYTVRISPKTAAGRKNIALDIDWALLEEHGNPGPDKKPERRRRLHAGHYTLNAQNNYSAQDTITFPCVNDAQRSQGNLLWFSRNTNLQLKEVGFGFDIVRVYE